MSQTKTFQWIVVGAGPAGIAAVGRLLDLNISQDEIAWIDPAFSVGDFGKKWRRVSSNTKVKLFNQFLHAVTAFEHNTRAHQYELTDLDPDSTCLLEKVFTPLQDITNVLKDKVSIYQNQVRSLSLDNRYWQCEIDGDILLGKRVILAVGAKAKTLNYDGLETIALEDALDITKLHPLVDSGDHIAVFGASHSAIMAVRNCLEQSVKQVTNFYLHPCRYAIEFDDWTMFNDTGLKGTTAAWARENIDGQGPQNLQRIYASDENIAKILPDCNKVIYAIGFAPRQITIHGFPELVCNHHSGILAPGLFGFGIAYPELHIDRVGLHEYRVGLAKFMLYLDKTLPIWDAYLA